MIPNPELESQASKAQAAVQYARLIQLLPYLKEKAPFYRKLFAAHQTPIDKIRSLADLKLLPITTKADVQQYNRDFFCVPDAAIRDYTTTSGTLGQPVLIPLTERDLQRLAYNEWLSMQYIGVTQGNKVQLMLTLDRQFMAGMAYLQGIQKAGATAIRTGPGLPALQWDMIFRLGVDTLVAVPSFLLKMLQYAQENGIDYVDSPVKKVLAIGESIRDEHLQPNTLLRTIHQQWPLQFYGTYAATEMQTAFTECHGAHGGHLHPELLIVELLDDEGNAVPQDAPGEITITTLGVEGMPLLRYRTGDIARMYYEPCICGRTSPRLGPVLGRKQQMIKYKGTTIYPPALFDLLQQSAFVSEYFVALHQTATGQDDLRLYVVATGEESECKDSLLPLLKHKLRALPELIFLDQEAMRALQFPADSRKQLRFKDFRCSPSQPGL